MIIGFIAFTKKTCFSKMWDEISYFSRIKPCFCYFPLLTIWKAMTLYYNLFHSRNDVYSITGIMVECDKTV